MVEVIGWRRSMDFNSVEAVGSVGLAGSRKEPHRLRLFTMIEGWRRTRVVLVLVV